MTTCTARGQVQANLDQFVNDMTAHFRECKGANLAAGAHQEGRHSIDIAARGAVSRAFTEYWADKCEGKILFAQQLFWIGMLAQVGDSRHSRPSRTNSASGSAGHRRVHGGRDLPGQLPRPARLAVLHSGHIGEPGRRSGTADEERLLQQRAVAHRRQRSHPRVHAPRQHCWPRRRPCPWRVTRDA